METINTQMPKPGGTKEAPNPWNTHDFQDIVLRLVSITVDTRIISMRIFCMIVN